MQKKWKSTLILGGIVLLLGIYFVAFEQNRPTDEELKNKKNEIALFEGIAIDSLEFYKDLTPIKAELKDGQWMITAPEQKEADAIAIQGIITQITTLKATTSIEPTPPASLANFGLDPSTQKIAFRKTGSADFTVIQIGKENALGTGMYIRLNNEQKVYNVPTTIGTIADQSLDTLKYKSPTPTPVPSNTPQPSTTPIVQPTTTADSNNASQAVDTVAP
jgi:hypothetical protein